MKKRIKNSWRRRSALVILLAALVLLLAPGAVSRGEGADEKRETVLYLAGEEGADGGSHSIARGARKGEAKTRRGNSRI